MTLHWYFHRLPCLGKISTPVRPFLLLLPYIAHHIPYIISDYFTSHCFTSHCFTSHYFTSHYFTSNFSTSHHITSRHVTSRHVTSRHARHVTSRHVTSRHVTSRHVTSRHITSHHITSHYRLLKTITHFSSAVQKHPAIFHNTCSSAIQQTTVQVLNTQNNVSA